MRVFFLTYMTQKIIISVLFIIICFSVKAAKPEGKDYLRDERALRFNTVIESYESNNKALDTYIKAKLGVLQQPFVIDGYTTSNCAGFKELTALELMRL